MSLQLSYAGVQIFNLHILLLIWAAFIGIIAYAEILTWYLLREPAQKEVITVDAQRSSSIKDFFVNLYKILKGEKVRSKP